MPGNITLYVTKIKEFTCQHNVADSSIGRYISLTAQNDKEKNILALQNDFDNGWW